MKRQAVCSAQHVILFELFQKFLEGSNFRCRSVRRRVMRIKATYSVQNSI